MVLLLTSSSIAHADDWSRAQIQFWKKIFTEYTTGQWVIHDSMNLSHIYRVVSENPEKARQEVIHGLRQIHLKNRHRQSVDVSVLSETEQQFFEAMEANEDPRAYEFASTPSRVRIQRGLKDQIANAVVISKQYLPRMEEMFEEEGVPKELTRLPFVESCFVSEACSVVGATGIWQFMPKTASKNLRVDAVIDERYDPLKSTRAAAKFLRENYSLLKSWDLSVMAYHHGAGLVQKAVRQLNTRDPFRIIQYFKDPRFRFASRNYLFEWKAMVEIHNQRIEGALPSFITVSFQKKKGIRDLFRLPGVKEQEIRLLNPHFRDPIWSGKEPVPAHYPVRLSGITLEEFRKHEYSQ